ncbi:NACHT domain-containing protein [Mycena chlorophos]|uniref:NACHT domain-containing protein n=1 Tax=Mycena chlorophos TaxID=658473 RepID=A0A8H6RZT6_MYCCL|nr:NACHT domain-containing protein [Mycena chlorophos]
MSPSPPPPGLSSSKPSQLRKIKKLFSKSKPGPKLSSNLKDVNASAPALISGHGNTRTGLDVPASSRANASLDLHAADSTPAISSEAHEVQPSVGKHVASAAWTATKTAAKIAETVLTGTPFNILLPALNQVFEIIDIISLV